MWPAFSGHIEQPGGGIVGNAVEHVIRRAAGAIAIDAGKVDHADDLARVGIDAGDLFLAPDVGKNFAIYVFQLVELIDGFAIPRDAERAGGFHGAGIDDANLGAAVAEEEKFPVIAQPPTLAGVGEIFFPIERLGVVDESGLVLPCQLIDEAMEHREAFAKIRALELLEDQRFARGRMDAADG